MFYLIRNFLNKFTNKISGKYFNYYELKYAKPQLPVGIGLGRWKIETCNKKTDYKTDMANRDHCGPCGKYPPPTL